ncbi:MAG: metal-sensing transcriptional repressor, partial [Oscillospiraceae bacterium]
MMADKTKVLRLLKTAKGQLEAVIKMVEEDRYCIDISHQLMASEALLNTANRQVLTAHLKHCVNNAQTEQDRNEKVEQNFEITLKKTFYPTKEVLMKQKFDVTGMTCSACSSRVEKSVEKLPGIQKVSVNLLTNSMQVEYDEKSLDDTQIMTTVEKAGYGAFPTEVKGGAAPQAKENPVEEQIKSMKKRLVISFAFLIPLMYISMGSMWGAPIPSVLSGHKNAISFAFIQFLLC